MGNQISSDLNACTDSMLQDIAQTIGYVSYGDIMRAKKRISKSDLRELNRIARMYCEADAYRDDEVDPELDKYFVVDDDGDLADLKGDLKKIVERIAKPEKAVTTKALTVTKNPGTSKQRSGKADTGVGRAT